jgi:hypothetical protein
MMEKDALERAPERGVEAAIGFGMELVGGSIARKLIGRPIAKVAAGKVPKAVKEIDEIGARLRAKGITTDDSFVRLMQKSPQERDRILRAANNVENSVLAIDLKATASRINTLMDENRLPGALPQNFWKGTMDALERSQQQSRSFVRLFDDKLASQLEKTRQDLTATAFGGALRQPTSDQAVGKYVRASLDQGKANTKAAKNAIYDPLFKRADADPNLQVDPIAYARELRRAVNTSPDRPQMIMSVIQEIEARPANAKKLAAAKEKLGKIQTRLDNPKTTDATKGQLEKQAEVWTRSVEDLEAKSGPLTPSLLHHYERKFAQMSELGELAGSEATLSKAQATKVFGAAKSQLDQLFSNNIDPTTGKVYFGDWQAAKEAHKRFLQYRQGDRAGFLDEVLGETVKTDRELANFVYADPQNAERLLATAMRDDPANFGKLRETMQSGYLKRIGLNGRRVGSSNTFDFDEGMVRSLFADPQKPRSGDLAASRLRDLQAQFKRLNLPPEKITAADVEKLAGSLTERSRNEILESIKRRTIAEAALDKAENTLLLDAAKTGYKQAVAQGTFPRAIIDQADESTTKAIMGKLNPKEQQVLRQEFFEELFNRYPGNADTTRGGFNLFDGPKFLRDIGENQTSELARKTRLMLGDELFDTMVDVARILPASQTSSQTANQMVTGIVSVNDGAPSARLYGAAKGIFSTIGDRMITAKYRMGKPQLVSFLRDYKKLQFEPEKQAQLMNKTFATMVGTQNGIQALTQTGKYDPEWGFELGQFLDGVLPYGMGDELRQEKRDFRGEFGSKQTPDGF